MLGATRRVSPYSTGACKLSGDLQKLTYLPVVVARPKRGDSMLRPAICSIVGACAQDAQNLGVNAVVRVPIPVTGRLMVGSIANPILG